MCFGWLDVHLAGYAPAFTLSFHDSEFARKPPMPIASVVSHNYKKNKYDSRRQFILFDITQS